MTPSKPDNCISQPFCLHGSALCWAAEEFASQRDNLCTWRCYGQAYAGMPNKRHLQSEWEHHPYPSPRRKASLVPVYVVWDGLSRRELYLRKCFTLTVTNRALMEAQVGVECQA